jgi:hypothetical protein
MDDHEDSALPISLLNKTIDESVMINDLLISSIPFKNFYDAERMKIKSTLFWINYDTFSEEFGISLPKDHLAKALKLNDGNWLIIIREIQEKPSIIAHELAHIALDSDAKGFPFVEPNCDYRDDEDFKDIADSLNNAIQDPLVIGKLQSYQFDLNLEYLKECEDAIIELKKTTGIPSGISGIKFTIDHLKHLLENEELGYSGNHPCNEFSIMFERRFPIVAKRAKELHKIISDVGFQESRNVSIIYQKIIDFFKLSEFLQVRR